MADNMTNRVFFLAALRKKRSKNERNLAEACGTDAH